MIYCINCGTGLQDDTLFCNECGTKVDKTTVPIAAEVKVSANKIIETEIPVATFAPVKEAIAETPSVKQYCRNCGNHVEAGSFACLKCGLPPMKAFNFCPACGGNCHQDAVLCIKCGVKLESQDSLPKAATTDAPAKAFCRNCGKDVLKDAVACLNCGLPPAKSKNFCASCGSETHNEAVICIKCGAALEQFTTQQTQLSSVVSQQQFASQQAQLSHAVSQRPTTNQSNNVVMVGSQKSVGTAFLLAFLFGPLGLLYASVLGGILMFFISIILFFIIPIVGYLFAWIACIIWAVVAAQNANNAALNKAGNIASNMNKQQ